MSVRPCAGGRRNTVASLPPDSRRSGRRAGSPGAVGDSLHEVPVQPHGEPPPACYDGVVLGPHMSPGGEPMPPNEFPVGGLIGIRWREWGGADGPFGRALTGEDPVPGSGA